MIASITASDVERFRAVVAQRIGLQFDDSKLEFLGEVLQRRLHKLTLPIDPYLLELVRKSSRDEFAVLAQELTVTETYFFRNNEQFRALAEIVLPQRMHAARTPGVLRILSAGCASGEEAYSIAVVVRETIGDPSWDALIRAVDLNPAALQKSRRARYTAWALRETPPDARSKWFRSEGADWILDESIRQMVRFESHNLADEDPDLWQSASYDVVFCRNVLMYFAPDQMHAAIARIARSLAPGGFLFLGHAETLRGVSDDFHLRHTHETFYYQRKGGDEHVSPPPARSARELIRTVAAVGSLDATWFDTIRDASERVSVLVAGAVPAPARAPAPPSWNLAQARDLLGEDRFVEALACLRALPPESGTDPDVLVFEAALLVQSGQLVAAEESCRRLLLIDELNAGAHYVLALCREHAGDRTDAAEHDRVATYLDPGFAMPRLHLGLLARGAGERDVARRELGQALTLLYREDASRLLLFGGGFSRESLIALCRSALRDCGGRP